MPALIEFRGVTKQFGAVTANKAVSFSIAEHQVHGIVGENGAGKSTIMKILYGLYPPDAGEILFRGNSVRFPNPQEAIRLGIGMVHQHFMLVPTLSVWENVVLGGEPTLGRLPKRELIAKLEALQTEFGFSLPLDSTVENLGVGQQQQVEILKLLYRNANILILDEPTAVLTPQEVLVLFEKLRKLKASGKTIVLITHKLKEILGFTETVTVMRNGEVVETIPTASLDEGLLAEKIVGRKQKALPSRTQFAKQNEVTLQIRALNAERGKNRLANIEFNVAPGEIVGIAGIEGNGQQELVEVLAGLLPYEGNVQYQGKEIRDYDPYRLRQEGFSLIPPDRHHDGLILEFSVEENFRLGHHRESRFLNFGPIFNREACTKHAEKLIREFDVRPPLPEVAIAGLSGGNQQKVIVGRETENQPHFVLASHPTRGVDIGAIEFIHTHFLNLRQKGTAILLLSSELDEILALSDRIIVLCRGKISGQCTRAEATEQKLGLWMTGGNE